MTGPSPLFEGEMGFIQQVSGPLDLPDLGGPRAADWMLPQTSIKFVPAEYHSQSAIAAAFDLRREIGDPRRIRSIEIATIRTAVEIIANDPEKWRPATRETADHSLPYCTVVALMDGEVSAAQFTAERLHDPQIQELMSRTRVVEDPALSARYPAEVPNRLTVTLADGATLVRELSHPPGHARRPLCDAELDAKFHGMVDPILGNERALHIRARIDELEADHSPHETFELMRR